MILTFLIKEITLISLIHCARFEALMVMTVKITVFWKMIPHTLVCHQQPSQDTLPPSSE